MNPHEYLAFGIGIILNFGASYQYAPYFGAYGVDFQPLFIPIIGAGLCPCKSFSQVGGYGPLQMSRLLLKIHSDGSGLNVNPGIRAQVHGLSLAFVHDDSCLVVESDFSAFVIDAQATRHFRHNEILRVVVFRNVCSRSLCGSRNLLRLSRYRHQFLGCCSIARRAGSYDYHRCFESSSLFIAHAFSHYEAYIARIVYFCQASLHQYQLFCKNTFSDYMT